MSITTLFTGGKKVQIIVPAKESNTNDSILEIDATPTITHNRISSLTKSPIEDGSEITDHITLENKTVTIEGVITKNPFNFFSSATSTIFSSTIQNNQRLSGIAASIGGLLSREPDRVENSLIFLNQIWENRIPFTIVAGLETYDNVVIKNLTITETSKTKNSIKFTATLEQVTFATTESSLIAQSSQAIFDKQTGRRAAPSVNRGQQIAPETETATSKKSSSVLFKIGQLSGAIDN
ncbi:MAG: hypothetical protein GY730_10305 [bacterium]|nr:hypothetical protein [bacterium]